MSLKCVPVSVVVLFLLLQISSMDRPELKESSKVKVQSLREAKTERKRLAFRKGRELLTREGVPFDPDILLDPQWKVRLRSTLDEMPQMQLVRHGGRKLKGVQLAHTLYLPDDVQLYGDTVILARYLVFSGRKVLIKGNHDIHVFTSEQTVFTEESAASKRPGMAIKARLSISPEMQSQEGHITIDTSGPGRDEWLKTIRSRSTASLPLRVKGLDYAHGGFAASQVTIDRSGAPGADGSVGAGGSQGQHGSSGSNGSNGSCSSNIHGSDGALGQDGSNGGSGTSGGNGTNGEAGGTISIEALIGTTYTLISNGGRGGNGGAGGVGGFGGNGGQGGQGGNGASCTCVGGQGSNGGRGGNGGFGGWGGNGGSGGNGANGGNGGPITVEYPYGYNPSNISATSHGGGGGSGGGAGLGGFGGQGGSGGQGGNAASGFSCSGSGNQGQAGNSGIPGNSGNGGTSAGNSGSPGSPGNIDIQQMASCPRDCQLSECPDACLGPMDYCMYSGGCPGGAYNNGYCCFQPSPIILDIDGDGVDLTDAAHGVMFDLTGDGVPRHNAWTNGGDDDAWLALDRNGNGAIDNGTELFGNFTPQPQPAPGIGRNGFFALATYDRSENGGNADGRISSQDSIFSSLYLWQDANHNGICESSELHSLSSRGVVAIDLDYRRSRRMDKYGNLFGYRAKVYDGHGASVGRWAWDVFLVSSP